MAKNSICKIDGCDKPALTRGWCSLHYARWKRHKDPVGGRTYQGDPLVFLFEVASICVDEKCLAWPFSRTKKGEARVYKDGRLHQAARVVCEKVNGPPPTKEHHAAHRCGKAHEGCVNQSHIRWATPEENENDKILHGTRVSGEKNGQSKIVEAQAAEILSLKGKATHEKIGKMFGVSASLVGLIHSGDRWPHLQRAPFK